ncbi:MAG: type II secretion system F family protein [Planctomyces sp.]|nr:type II secretion system F family protein [Planctomyces sp.]
MFGSRLPLKTLAHFCRSLSTTLHAGVPVVKAMRLAGSKQSNSRLRTAVDGVVNDIESGATISEALDARTDLFPELLVDMVRVAEHTGMLPEVFRSLADHFENNLRLKKDFLSQISWPVIQFFAAILIVAGLILVLGVVGSGPDQLDPLGFGLSGAGGALTWLGGWAMLLVSGFLVLKIVLSSPTGQRSVYSALLRLPVVGGCLESFAIARFSWAFYLTQEAGMPIQDSLRASLKATGNGAFIAAGNSIVRGVEHGETLTQALAASELFSDEFIQMVDVGETSGTVPETLHRLSPQFEEQARRSMKTLSTAAGWGIWAMVAAFIIFLIFRIALWYANLLNSATDF